MEKIGKISHLVRKNHTNSKLSRQRRDTTTSLLSTKRRTATASISNTWLSSKQDKPINNKVCVIQSSIVPRSLTREVPDVEVAKRPKLEAHASAASSGTTSSGTSYQGTDASNSRARVESSASSSGQWPSHEAPTSQNCQTSSTPKVHSLQGAPTSQASPSATSPTVLPGYRESMFGSTQQGLPWRDGQQSDNLPKLPRISSVYERRSSFANGVASDEGSHSGLHQHPHRTAQGHPPPLLTSDSTNRSTGSSASNNSSAIYTPHTPLEPPLDRALPIPAMYSQKPPGSAENHLPPLRAPSLSPQSTLLGLQQSPNSKNLCFERYLKKILLT